MDKGFPSDYESLLRNNQAYDMNYLMNLSSKKLKIEQNPNGLLKNASPEANLNRNASFESVKVSGSIPYAITKPSQKGFKSHGIPENNMYGKRIHPDLALEKAIEDMKRSKGFVQQQAPVMNNNNNELYEMMRLLNNTAVPDMSNYNLNYGKLPYQLPNNRTAAAAALNYPASLFQNFEQQLNYYNQMSQVLQQQQREAEILNKMQLLSKIQSQAHLKPELDASANLMNTTCLIEDVANQKKSLKLDQAHLEKRHKISSVTEVRLEDLSSENKVFKFSSSKFNVTINKKGEDNSEAQGKVVSPQNMKKQTISNNFQGINLSTPLVHQRVPILY